MLKGAFILVLANFIVKFIGVIYKIPLTNLIGGYGMGFFNSAFEIHQMLLAFSTAGLPVAVSKMVSESNALGRHDEVQKIFRVVLVSFSVIGILFTALMFFGAPGFSHLIKSDLTKYSIMALAPSIFFYAIISIFRGYFQGHENMVPTASTQVIEAIFKLFVGISLAYYLIKIGMGMEHVSAGAIFGTTAGTIVAAIILIAIYFSPKNRRKRAELRERDLTGECRSSKKIFTDLIKIVVPVTAGSLVVNLTGFLDLFLIMSRLGDIGFSEAAATTIYGTYKSCAQTLFNLPPSIITSINVSVIPAVAAAFVLGNRDRLQHIIGTALRVVSLFAIPCAVALCVFADPILHLLFPRVAAEEIAIATPLLRIMGIASLWASVSGLSTAALQAVGRVKLPVLSMAIGGCIKLAANYFLVGTPSIGITGAPIGTNLCYLAIMIINLTFLYKTTNVSINIKSFVIKPIISAAVMGALALVIRYFLAQIMPSSIATIIMLLLAIVIYFAVLMLVGGLRAEDIAMVPGGRRIIKLLRLK